jgi:hypothetical protein
VTSVECQPRKSERLAGENENVRRRDEARAAKQARGRTTGTTTTTTTTENSDSLLDSAEEIGRYVSICDWMVGDRQMTGVGMEGALAYLASDGGDEMEKGHA